MRYALAAAFVIASLIYFDLRDTFKNKCRSDVKLSENAGRIADALERR